MMTLALEVSCGTMIEDACKDAALIVSRVGCAVSFDFNGKTCFLYPGDSADDLVKAWHESRDKSKGMDLVFARRRLG